MKVKEFQDLLRSSGGDDAEQLVLLKIRGSVVACSRKRVLSHVDRHPYGARLMWPLDAYPKSVCIQGKAIVVVC